MTQKKNRQNVKYFSSTFFFLEEVFFFFFSLGSSNASAMCCKLLGTQQESVCRRTPAACPPHSHQLPRLKSHKLGSVRATDYAGERGSTQTPTHCSAQDTGHLTLHSSVLPICPTTQKEEKKRFPECLAEA